MLNLVKKGNNKPVEWYNKIKPPFTFHHKKVNLRIVITPNKYIPYSYTHKQQSINIHHYLTAM